jgi:hypothetical protein
MLRKQAFSVCPSILAAVLALGATARAQEISTPTVEIGGSCSWFHLNSADDVFHRTGNGGSGYIEYNLTS